MSQAKVFALPLFHADSKEYLRVRRGIEQVAGERSSVAYELPKNPSSERLTNEVLGRSGSDLDVQINEVLEEFHAPQIEAALCDLIELDHAKHIGQIRNVYPIDIDPSIQSLREDNPAYMKFMIKMGQRTDQLDAAILHPYPFKNVLSMMRDIIALEVEGFGLKEVRIKDNVEQILGENQDDKLLLMLGAMHLPSLEAMLKHDGIAVVEMEAPNKVSGVWWTAHSAMEELRAARESGIDYLYGPELLRYALLMSLNLVKTVRFNELSRAGGSSISDDEAKAILNISTFAEAESFYDKMQAFYRKRLADSIIDLSKLHREE